MTDEASADHVKQIASAVENLTDAIDALGDLNLVERMQILDALNDTVFGKYREGIVDRLARIEGNVQTMLHHSTIRDDGVSINIDNNSGDSMSDNRNQSVTAGGNANAHNSGVSDKHLKAILIAIVAAVALAFGYRVVTDQVDLTPPHQDVEDAEDGEAFGSFRRGGGRSH